ncbi:MAG TPA: PAS domain-containing protein [Alphaproteobacteria bacterium]|jgi:hypothetical protein
MFENAFAAEERPLGEIGHERLRRLHAYWETERQPARWLAYDRLRPERIAYALSDLAVLERKGAGGDRALVVRLAGEAMRMEGLGFVRGKTSADLRPAWFRDHLIESCRRAFQRAAPVYSAVTLNYQGGRYPFEQLLLPLVRRGPEPDCLLMAVVLSQTLIDLKATLKGCIG